MQPSNFTPKHEPAPNIYKSLILIGDCPFGDENPLRFTKMYSDSGVDFSISESFGSAVRIGNGNTIYNGAVIAATPQDFKYTGDDTIARIGNNNTIRENAVIIRATFAGDEISFHDKFTTQVLRHIISIQMQFQKLQIS